MLLLIMMVMIAVLFVWCCYFNFVGSYGGVVNGVEAERFQSLTGSVDEMKPYDDIIVFTILHTLSSAPAQAQETKERLAQVFRQVSLKSYPNVNDPKAGIAAMLK